MAVGYSRCTSDQPGPKVSGCSASSACRWASTPSFCSPGSAPRARARSRAAPRPCLIWSVSPSRPRTSQRPTSGSPATERIVRRRQLGERAGRAHPVQRLVRPVVGVNRHRAVRLDQDQPGRHRQVGRQPPGVVDLAARNHQPHRAHPTFGGCSCVSGAPRPASSSSASTPTVCSTSESARDTRHRSRSANPHSSENTASTTPAPLHTGRRTRPIDGRAWLHTGRLGLDRGRRRRSSTLVENTASIDGRPAELDTGRKTRRGGP